MSVEAIVSMLEEHLSDIRQRLEAGAWRRFVEFLDSSTRSINPTEQGLEQWAVEACSFLSGFDYTRGLLQGIASAAERHRAVPVDLVASSRVPGEQSPPKVRLLLDRIKRIATKARSLA